VQFNTHELSGINTMELSVYTYGSNGQQVITSSVPILPSTWYHVAIVSETNSFNLYVDGILTASSHVITFKINNLQRLTLTIGSPIRKSIDDKLYSSMCHIDEFQIQSNRSEIGIDNLRFYSRQLKIREIQALSKDEYVVSKYFFDQNEQ
jgi:hypothetical protein